jgi:hypothetical protein
LSLSLRAVNGIPSRIGLFHFFTIFAPLLRASRAFNCAMQHPPDNIFSLSFQFRFVIIESIGRL